MNLQLSLKRATQMFMRGGPEVLDAFSEVLGTDGWKKFPAPYGKLMEVLWSEAPGKFARFEHKLDEPSLKLVLEVEQDIPRESQWSYEDMVSVAEAVRESYLQYLQQTGLRALGEQAGNGSNASQVTQGISDLLVELENEEETVNQLISAKEGVRRARRLLDSWYDGDLDASIIRCGISSIDQKCPLERGETSAIIGYTGVGKSALTFQLSANVAKLIAAEKRPGCVLVFSMEMTADRLWLRVAASDARVNTNSVRNGKVKRGEAPRLDQVLNEYEDQLALEISEQAGLTASQMRRFVQRASRKHGGVELIVLDYGDLAAPDAKSDNETSRIDAIIREFRSLVHNHSNPNQTKPAGLIVARTLKRSDRSLTSPVMLPIEQIIRGAGHYHIGTAIVPIAPKDHFHVDENGAVFGAPDVLSFMRARGIEPGEVGDNDRWLWVPKSRHDWTGCLPGFRFIPEYTRWEQTWED